MKSKIKKHVHNYGLGIFFAILIIKVSIAYPVSPSKVGVSGIDLTKLKTPYTLAWDSSDRKIVYYAPKTGRVALFSGMPLLGFGKLPDGRSVLNVQFEFEIEQKDREILLSEIKKAGFTPVPFPFFKTTVKPLFQGWDPETGKLVCSEDLDLSTQLKTKNCSQTIYDSVSYLKNGPTLGENIGFSTILNQNGTVVMTTLLGGGSAVQVGLEAQYYAAGDAFTASIDVNFEKLYQSFSAYAGYKGFLTTADIEAFWSKESLCGGKLASECSVIIQYKDSRGRLINNVTMDPHNPDAVLILQSVERLKQKLEDEMLTPITPILTKADSNLPKIGWKYNAKFESRKKEKHAHFEFSSPIGVNIENTLVIANIACIRVLPTGAVSRETNGDCKYYWNGTIGFDDLVKRRLD